MTSSEQIRFQPWQKCRFKEGTAYIQGEEGVLTHIKEGFAWY